MERELTCHCGCCELRCEMPGHGIHPRAVIEMVDQMQSGAGQKITGLQAQVSKLEKWPVVADELVKLIQEHKVKRAEQHGGEVLRTGSGVDMAGEVMEQLLDLSTYLMGMALEAREEQERYRQEARDSATQAGKALRELREARQDVEYWKGKYEAAAMDALAAAPKPDCICPTTRHDWSGQSVTETHPDASCPQHGDAVAGTGQQDTTTWPTCTRGCPGVLCDHPEACPLDADATAATQHGPSAHGRACCDQMPAHLAPMVGLDCGGVKACDLCREWADEIHAAVPVDAADKFDNFPF